MDARPVDPFALTARSAQQALVRQDATGQAMQRAHQTVTELQSLLDRVVAAGGPPRGTGAERRHQALLVAHTALARVEGRRRLAG